MEAARIIHQDRYLDLTIPLAAVVEGVAHLDPNASDIHCRAA